MSVKGSSAAPPINSCHPVAATRFDGVGYRFVNTTPIANDTLAPAAASRPT